jgi:hypothetical protein
MIKENIHRIKERVSDLCSQANRDAQSIKIVAVAKSRTVEEIREAIEAGMTEIGENRIQEASLKYDHFKMTSLELSNIKWHMVGHLQTNKARAAVKMFDLIHSVDSLPLAQELDKQAEQINKVQDVLIEVNTSGEETKFGLKPESTVAVIKTMLQLNNINIKGLMTVAPFVEDPEKTRSYFRTLRELIEEINRQGIAGCQLRELSMGMTDDYGVAVEEGATIIRLGRAIFER